MGIEAETQLMRVLNFRTHFGRTNRQYGNLMPIKKLAKTFFDVLLTVYLSIILVITQLNAKNLVL